MSSWPKLLFASLLFCAASAQAQEKYPGIGRAATPAEVAAWDIDVRPDFKGLPKGAGTVNQGMLVWESRCASCHGSFGESNEVFTPMIGGTTPADIKSGHVLTLTNDRQPQRTTMMKLSTLSTLWDYINRAMPWNAPKTLKTDEVYAVTAYILNMAEVVPDDFTLSDKNIAEVQKLIPNRDGMTLSHGMRTAKGKPDVANTACMTNCGPAPKVQSELPAYARNAHGNNAEQNRLVGPVRGANTLESAPGHFVPVSGSAMPAVRPPPAAKAAAGAVPPAELAKKQNCTACHSANSSLVGPSWAAIHKKYFAGGANAAASSALAAKIRSGGAGAWGAVPMPAQPQLKEEELQSLVNWISSGAK